MAALDIHLAMAKLAERRPIFHSEADFQFALAWQIREMTPDCKVRLEKPFTIGGDKRSRHLDIWLPNAGTAIELKYGIRALRVAPDGELFALKDRARDLYRYDFIKDVQRIEGVVESSCGSAPGYAILLANDHLYWEHRPGKTNNDEAFHLREGRNLTGTMAWVNDAKVSKERKNHLTLAERTNCGGGTNSALPGIYGTFRYLAVEVR